MPRERNQASGWLWDEEDDLLYSLSRKISAATGLEAHRAVLRGQGFFEHAEPWQVGVYTPGGHYLPHYDDFDLPDHQSVTPEGLWVGNRIATSMAYLSDVQGGFTVFPELDLAARPRRGSVLFWFDLDTDGDRDRDALHGACPTILGTKWVANKWIREGHQIWRRPCLP